MPCSDGGVPYPPSEDELLNAKTPAMLCAIWSAIGTIERAKALRDVNWAEAGVTKEEFERWWELHSLLDASRKAREFEHKHKERVKAKALSKLTDAEKRALGLE